MDRERLRSYAELIARMGVNIQPGQQVIIRTEPEQLAFLEMLIDACYQAGASKVELEWRFPPALRRDIQYQSADMLGQVEPWQEQRLKERCELLPANIYLDCDDPDALAGVDQNKWAEAQQRRFSVIKPYREAMENKYQWCVAAVPGRSWARKVFPELETEQAVERLWELILSCARVEKDPLANWQAHNESLRRHCERLNALKLRRLFYRSVSTGTDLQVGLMPQMRFCGGSDRREGDAVEFNANIPTEEVYTTPRKGDAEGVVYATMPLAYRGVLIEDFWLRFEGGRVVEAHAKTNEETLKRLLQMDEGASMLGECAFVPYESPIRKSGVLFYNTLFDENASCHLALGDGYSSCLENFDQYTAQQARELGVNDSMIHEDFMIGAADLDIWGITEAGERVDIFKRGSWAEEIL